MHFAAHLGSVRNQKQMVLVAGIPLGSISCQPMVAGSLLLALSDWNILGQWQKKSNLFHWAAYSNSVWQNWHSILNISLEYINLSVFQCLLCKLLSHAEEFCKEEGLLMKTPLAKEDPSKCLQEIAGLKEGGKEEGRAKGEQIWNICPKPKLSQPVSLKSTSSRSHMRNE